MRYQIDKDVPMPARRESVKWKAFPFADMGVGDSFKFDPKNPGTKPQTVGYLAAVYARQEKPQAKFKVRETANGYRCWRIK